MAKKPIKETIHAKGVDISIYTTDFKPLEFEGFLYQAGLAT